MRLIPAIDIRNGRCVRLFQGDFGQETRYDVDPIDLATRYAAEGCEWLHIVDLDGAASGKPVILDLVAAIQKATALNIQLGGGIRSEQDLTVALAIVQRVVIGSLAVSEPETVARWLETYGGDRITLALDIRLDATGIPRITTHGWTQGSELSLWAAIERYMPAGLRHVLCTDVERDGALTGPNFELYADCKKRWPNVLLQASGGVRDAHDLVQLDALGIDFAISGKALLEGRITTEELRPFLRSA